MNHNKGESLSVRASLPITKPGEVMRRFFADDRGQDLVEYSLLLAFIGLVGAALFIGMGQSSSSIWSIVNSRVSSANQAS